jgi:hypothetical protein
VFKWVWFPIKDASTCVPFRMYGDGADASQHFELFTILPLLCCSRSTLDNRIVTAIRNSNKTTPECRQQILVVLAWSFEALRNLIKYPSKQSFWNWGMFGDLPFALILRSRSTQEELKLNIINWNLSQLPSILWSKVLGYIHIKIHGGNRFQRHITQKDLQWQGAG